MRSCLDIRYSSVSVLKKDKSVFNDLLIVKIIFISVVSVTIIV